MLTVDTRAFPPYWGNRLNYWTQRCQGLNPRLIEISKELFAIRARTQDIYTKIDPLPEVRNFCIDDPITLLSNKEAQANNAEALRTILPKPGKIPTHQEVYNSAALQQMCVQDTHECYLVDRFYSSKIDQGGLALINRLTAECSTIVDQTGKYSLPKWTEQHEMLDISALLFFERVVARKKEEVGFKLALDNPFPNTPQLQTARNRWDDFVNDLGFPPTYSNYSDFEPCPERLEWKKKVLPETFKQLREALDKDMEIRKTDPHAPLANITYSFFREKKFLDSLIKKGIRVASIAFGSLGVYFLYRYGYTPTYVMAKL